MGAVSILEKEDQATRMELQENAIAELLLQKNEAAFEHVFKSHFKRLYAYAFTILSNGHEAEEIVQQVFYKLWERSDSLNLQGSLTAYLYRAVHNESLNLLKRQKVRSNHKLYVAYSMKSEEENASRKVTAGELEKKIHEVLNELPEQCRTIFQMSRFDELKYREIAGKLNISVKTVENQMGKALKIMRSKLVEFLSLLIILLNF